MIYVCSKDGVRSRGRLLRAERDEWCARALGFVYVHARVEARGSEKS